MVPWLPSESWSSCRIVGTNEHSARAVSCSKLWMYCCFCIADITADLKLLLYCGIIVMPGFLHVMSIFAQYGTYYDFGVHAICTYFHNISLCVKNCWCFWVLQQFFVNILHFQPGDSICRNCLCLYQRDCFAFNVYRCYIVVCNFHRLPVKPMYFNTLR